MPVSNLRQEPLAGSTGAELGELAPCHARITADGTIAWADAGWIRLGHPVEAVVGRSLLDLVSADVVPVLEALEAQGLTPTAATDVTGFGLARHLLELVQAGGVGARLFSEELPVHDGVLELLRQGVRSSFHEANRGALVGLRVDEDVDPLLRELLFDPQTCGPMLLGLPPVEAERLVDAGWGWVIGEVGDDVPAGTVHVVRRR